MIRNRWPLFAPALVAILYGSWLVLTAPPQGFADLAGAIMLGIGVLSAVVTSVFLIIERRWLRWRALWWRDLLVGILATLIALGAFVLLARA
jgi:hypothetical protein